MNPLPQNPTADFPPPCKAGTSPKVRAPMAVGQYGYNPGPCAGNWPTTVNIMDTVRIPKHIKPGSYVLSWRWDCELTAQVWNSCSESSHNYSDRLDRLYVGDIEIVAWFSGPANNCITSKRTIKTHHFNMTYDIDMVIIIIRVLVVQCHVSLLVHVSYSDCELIVNH